MGSGIDGMDYPTSKSSDQGGKDSWQYYFNGIYVDSTGRHQDVGVGLMGHLNDLLQKPNHVGVFQAVMFAMTSVLHFLGDYTSDHKMSQQGDVEKVLKQILDDNSKIEKAFDEIQNATNDTDKQSAAQDAIDARNDMEAAFNSPAGKHLSSETINSIRSSYGFGTGKPSGVFQGCKDNVSLAKAWDKLWHGDPPTPDPDPKKPFSVQSVTNPLGEVTNTVNGCSATAQSVLKWDESNLEQFLAMIHAIAAQVAAQMKAPVTAASSAGS